MDVHIRRAVVISLRLRSIDVLTAQEDGSAELGRVLVSQDEEILREGVRLLREQQRLLFDVGHASACRRAEARHLRAALAFDWTS